MIAPETSTPRPATVVGAELAGTFLVTSVIVGGHVFSGAAIGPLGTAIASGLAVVAGVALAGRTSGAHLNPAVTIGLAVAGRFPWRDVATYVVAQCVGALLGGLFVLAVAAGGPGTTLLDAQRAGFGSGGFDIEGSPDGYGLLAVALVETVLTATVVSVYVAAGPRRGTPAAGEGGPSAALVIGSTVLGATILAQPVSNAVFNPARGLAAGLFGGPESLGQVWAFVVFPLLGATAAGIATRWASRSAREEQHADED
jgi:aquaporin Z